MFRFNSIYFDQKFLSKARRYLLIIAAGGLGLMAVQMTKAITNSNILIMDVDDKKLKETKS
jgi:D-arabinose 1-dehydrogenase-like Zn-dependent alcohol dehydrogenase